MACHCEIVLAGATLYRAHKCCRWYQQANGKPWKVINRVAFLLNLQGITVMLDLFVEGPIAIAREPQLRCPVYL